MSPVATASMVLPILDGINGTPHDITALINVTKESMVPPVVTALRVPPWQRKHGCSSHKKGEIAFVITVARKLLSGGWARVGQQSTAPFLPDPLDDF